MKLIMLFLSSGGLQIPIPLYLLFLTVKENIKSGFGGMAAAQQRTNSGGESLVVYSIIDFLLNVCGFYTTLCRKVNCEQHIIISLQSLDDVLSSMILAQNFFFPAAATGGGTPSFEEKPSKIPSLVLVLVFIAALVLFLFDGNDEAYAGCVKILLLDDCENVNHCMDVFDVCRHEIFSL